MIEFEHVAKRYVDGTVAVEDFSLSVPSGTTTVLLGSSGSGKTTLLRMVNRMVVPTAGRVLLDGADVAAGNPVALRRHIGYVPQESGLLPNRRIVDNVTTVPRLLGTARDDARRRGLELMELVGLAPQLAQRFPSQLSGGQRQRVAVARALAADPAVLLMDEPFGAVDPIVRRDLQQLLLTLQQELHKTVLFVTHDVAEAFLLGDAVAVLRRGGELAQLGSPRELVAQPADEFVADFLGLNSGASQLHVDDGIVVDAQGRPVGRLASRPA